MRTSSERILTTHTGSLPRPPALVELYARRVAGEAIDEGALEAAAADAVHEAVRRQHETGIDVANNGEQTREAFFLYLRRRMSGFGGTGSRPPFRDVAGYPDFAALRAATFGSRRAVSNMAPPAVTEPIRYLDPAAIVNECRAFGQALEAGPNGFTETFLNAPSPGIVAAAVPNRHYDTEDAYLAASPRRSPLSTGPSSITASCFRSMRPTSPSSATYPSPTGRSPTSWASSSGWSTPSTAPSTAFQRSACACMSAGAITRARTTATCRWPISWARLPK